MLDHFKKLRRELVQIKAKAHAKPALQREVKMKPFKLKEPMYEPDIEALEIFSRIEEAARE